MGHLDVLSMQRRKRLGSLVSHVLMVVAIGFAPCAMALSMPDAFTELEIEPFRWSAIRQEELFGAKIWSRDFTVAMTADEAARALSARGRYFQSVNSIGGRIILSGLEHHWHWVAQFESAGGMASGFLSAMAVGSVELERALSKRSSYVLPWVPPSASLEFDHRSRQNNGIATQQIYISPLSKHLVLSHLQSSLTEAGWIAERDTRFSGGMHWRRKGARLWVSTVEANDHSAIFVQLLE